MADTKLSGLAALAGANVDATADLLYIDDVSATTSKKILVEELGISLNATQAGQETGTSTKTLVSPAVQHFHPSAPKAWGLVTTPTTITASYPAAGVSATNPSTGNSVVTHGRTMSSANYVVVLTVVGVASVNGKVTSQNATTFTADFRDDAGVVFTPTAFSYAIYGDL